MRHKIIRLLLLSTVALAGCPGTGVPAIPDLPGTGGAASSVDPNSCGNYAASAAGKKLKGFLEATLTLQESVASAEVEMKASCVLMATELGISTEGDTATVCKAVAAAIQEDLSVGLKAGAKLTVDYQPAQCIVSADVAAEVAAKCEASAGAEVAVTCEGTCEGTCKGTCEGSCEGSAGTGGSDGECNGACQGRCKGECSGGCDGHADVQASAECEAQAEIRANVEAECTEPELTVEFEADVVLDAPKVEKVQSALISGLPPLLVVSAKIQGPVRAAFTTWSKAAGQLADSSAKLYSSLGDQAACVAGQLGAAVAMIAGIQSSIDLQIEVSVSVSASASTAGGASAGG